MIGTTSTKVAGDLYRWIEARWQGWCWRTFNVSSHKKAIRLPDHCSVFQAEMCAIHEAILLLSFLDPDRDIGHQQCQLSTDFMKLLTGLKQTDKILLFILKKVYLIILRWKFKRKRVFKQSQSLAMQKYSEVLQCSSWTAYSFGVYTRKESIVEKIIGIELFFKYMLFFNINTSVEAF